MGSEALLIGDGYIGNALLSVLPTQSDILDIRYGVDYGLLTKSELKHYKTIVLMAGHSSVGQCIADPRGAWENNVTKFERLLDKISDKQTLIYASSGSVYNKCWDKTEENKSFYLTNIYDLTKFTIDQIAQLSGKNYYGLRFGTVCGYSPTMRWDLMINKMFKGKSDLRVSNPEITRPILAMSDLVEAVKAIIKDPTKPGIYNLASFSKTVGEIAQEVALDKGVGIETLPPTIAYDFDMDCSKFQKAYNFMFHGTVKSILESLKYEKVN